MAEGNSAATASSAVVDPDSQHSSEAAATAADDGTPTKSTRRPADQALTQQRMKSWQPLLDPKWVIAAYLLIGIVFIPTGERALVSYSLVYLQPRYLPYCTSYMHYTTEHISFSFIHRHRHSEQIEQSDRTKNDIRIPSQGWSSSRHYRV